MKILELFAGSRSIGKAAERLGYKVFSVDIEPFEGVNLVMDIENLELSDIPFYPDMIWASPPCTSYSIAAISHHRDGIKAMSAFASKSDKLVIKTLELISKYPKAIYYIENPVGMLRKMPFMRGLDRTTVTYCQYGHTSMKPTDIWSNNINGLLNPTGTWIPRKKCKRGSICHEAAPRGSKTGTQGFKNNFERSKIPEQLCKEVIEATHLRFKNWEVNFTPVSKWPVNRETLRQIPDAI